MGAYDTLNLNSCETLYARARRRHRAVLRLPPLREGRRGETCTTGSSSISGPALLHRRRVPGRLPGRAVLQRLLAQLHLGRVQGRRRAAGHEHAPDVRAGAAARCGSPRARTARSTTPTCPAAPCAASLRQQRAHRARHGDAAHGRGAADGDFDGTRLHRPRGRALTYAWDLDGDGAYDDSTGRAPVVHVPPPGTVTVRLRVTDPGGLFGTDTETITIGAPPTVTITAPDPPGRSATRSRSPPHASGAAPSRR